MRENVKDPIYLRRIIEPTRICDPVRAAKVVSGSTATRSASPYCFFKSSSGLIAASSMMSNPVAGVGSSAAVVSSPFAFAFLMALACGAMYTSVEFPGGTAPTRTPGCWTIADQTKAQKASSTFCPSTRPDDEAP